MRILILLALALPVFASKKPSRTMNPDEELKNREYMIEISRQLGVTCNACHDVKNFRNTSMKAWRTAKEHMNIVDLLNSRGFTKGPRVDCYMCHRGKAIPDYKENVSSAKPQEH